jgi:hypothetical protein
MCTSIELKWGTEAMVVRKEKRWGFLMNHGAKVRAPRGGVNR